MDDVMRDFNLMRARAYSNLSLKKPLSDSMFKKYKEIMDELKEE